MEGQWRLRSIPRKRSGGYDWRALPEGNYYVEWYEDGRRRRERAGSTVAEVQEAQRHKRHELEGRKLGLSGFEPEPQTPKSQPVKALVEQFLGHIETLKRPNTHRKYEAVLHRFAQQHGGRILDKISIEDLNAYVVYLKKDCEMSANTVLHNVIIIAQFFKRHGRGGITRELQLPEKITTLPREYREEKLLTFLGACNDDERALFSTFLLTGFREQEVMYLYWSDLNVELRTIRVTAKPERGFYPKRWEEREVPIPMHLVELLQKHPRREGSPFVFPSPRGNREQHMLDRCKEVAARAGLDPEKFDLKTFRSTYATRMLRAGLDVRTVQHWMGHKSLETTMRYLVPAADVHARLDQVPIPGVPGVEISRKSPAGKKVLRRSSPSS
jgi:site-specific recombinase XerD